LLIIGNPIKHIKLIVELKDGKIKMALKQYYIMTDSSEWYWKVYEEASRIRV